MKIQTSLQGAIFPGKDLQVLGACPDSGTGSGSQWNTDHNQNPGAVAPALALFPGVLTGSSPTCPRKPRFILLFSNLNCLLLWK